MCYCRWEGLIRWETRKAIGVGPQIAPGRGSNPSRRSPAKIYLETDSDGQPVRIAQVAERHVGVVHVNHLDLDAQPGAHAHQAAKVAAVAAHLGPGPQSQH